MLEVRNLSVSYGPHPALQDVSIRVGTGEIVVILGANGAGKSTLLRSVSGICEGRTLGDVALDGVPLNGLAPDRIVELGVALVPEGRGIFGDLTVRENLLLGAYSERARKHEGPNLDRVLKLFPKMRERRGQICRTMSGGEQQMVAIGRAMMSAPRILMLDEPSLGLSPILCKELFESLRLVRELDIGVLLVEQNAKRSLAIADRGYLIENTRITRGDTAARLAEDEAVQKAYLGAGGGRAVPAEPETAKSTNYEIPAPTPRSAPPPSFAAARSEPRREAEELIGASIDDPVNSAADRSAASIREPSAETWDAADRLARDRLTVVMRDIELAAAEARGRASGTDGDGSTLPAAPGNQAGGEGGKPPVIEIYRRPRVEIYRRRPNGRFERD